MSQSQDRLRELLEKRRKRLLDFSPKNELLSFKFSSKRIVRIIDGFADLIYTHLRNGEASINIEPFIGKWKEGDFDLRETNIVYEYFRKREHRLHLSAPLSAEQLESTLKNIYKSAKGLTAESGVNTLFIIFGFLEWSQDSSAGESNFAPILMAPINLDREKLQARSGTTIYSIEFSEGGAEINSTLREWFLQKYSPQVLPEYSADETPEQYFAKLRERVRAIEGMKVRNQIVLGIMPISSMLMYKDLDLDENPALLKQDIIRELLIEGSSNSGHRSIDHSIDDPDIDQELPALIFDADSSQHSALLDAKRGKNLVIEGPPGTGKSQTITNLIAAMLNEGKSVLFISEKKAALDVVYKRLYQRELAPFCLELHSHKTKIGDLVESLRLREKVSFSPSSIDHLSKKAFLNFNKKVLSDYAKAINAPYGGCGKTIHELIWGHQKLKNRFSFEPTLLDTISLMNADTLTYEEVERLKQYAEVYGIASAVVH